MAKSDRVVLVDGTWLLVRAFFALPANLVTAAGLHTNAAYGFATMFRKLFSGRRPTYGAVVFDAPGKLFRAERFPGYKADRPPAPPELREQGPWIDRIATANGFRTVRCPGWEADDVIGTLARVAADAGCEVVLVAGDKDFAQLIDERVKLFDPVKDVTYDATLAQKRWGVRPEQMIDLLALMGDAVDNIPGVAGIGEKSAIQLLEAHGDLDAVFAAVETLPTRQRTALQAGRDAALLSRELATIDRHAPIDLTLDDLRLADPDAAALDDLYRTLEFRSLLRGPAPTADAVAVPTVDAATVRGWLRTQRVAFAPVFVDRVLVGLGVATASDTGWCTELDGLAPIWTDPSARKVTHDSKLLGKAVGPLAGCEDTMLASFVVEPTKCIPHRLEQVAREYLQRALTETKGTPADPAAWAGERARAIAELWPILAGRLDEAGLDGPYRDQELALAPVLGRMELAGILVDREDLVRLGVEFRARRDALEAEVHALAGHPFNLGSTQQLATVLFEELKLPVLKKNKTGYSTDAEVLEALARDHTIAARLLDHRALSKLIHTYTDVLTAAVDPADGRVHATFQQTVGVSGRIISTDPDLQRTPTRTAEGKRIRRAFVAPPGFVLVSADWSQVELRVMAHVSGDPKLLEAFRSERDVHRATAAELFGVAEADVTPEQRTIGKTINFATIYGQGATALAQILGIPRKEAQAHIDRFFHTYAGVRRWLDRTIADASTTGFVTTLGGRRRFIPELSAQNQADRMGGERIAANTPIQGSAADLCKLAMLGIDARLRGMRSRLLLQVHDELVFEAPLDEVDALTTLVREEMLAPLPLAVPLVVNVGVGPTWADAH